MNIEQTFIKDLVILTPKYSKTKEVIFEAYNQAKFNQNGIEYQFIQDNQFFQKGVIEVYTQISPLLKLN
jgi:dTDP-4-dehydrorhamnose 3,5-epimerase